MSIKLRILGWKAEGLRCPDHEINFYNDQDKLYSISLIQMPNGTGKTTTLMLLRAALSGEAENDSWNEGRVMELQKKGSNVTEGLFELRLMSLNDKFSIPKRVTLRMEFNFLTAKVVYKTTGVSGQKEGFKLPTEMPGLSRFMNKEFVNFYVLDGELSKKLSKPQNTDAEQAVESLFQLNLLKSIERKISDHWREETKKSNSHKETGLSRRQNTLTRWEDRHEYLIKEQSNLETQVSNIETKIYRKNEKYKDNIEKNKEQSKKMNIVKENIESLNNKIQENTQLLLNEMRDPSAVSDEFSCSMFDLKSSLDRVKLPESAAREFFEELADEEHCVCGRPINSEIQKTIRERAQQYLGSNDVVLLNEMKSAISDAVQQSQNQPMNDMPNRINTVSIISKELELEKNEFDRLEDEAGRSNPDVEEAKKEIDMLERKRDNLDKELQKFEGKDENVNTDKVDKIIPEHIFAIKTANEIVEKCTLKVAEATHTVDVLRKREILIKIINDSHENARKTIALEIMNEANSKIKQLMPYNNISIEKIDRHLNLKGQSEASTGEELSVAYAFLSTLFNRADQHQLPFVVDSPANPIDLETRKKIGGLVPRLTEQFIAFMISSERSGFLLGLKESSGNDIQYITLFRERENDQMELKARANPSCEVMRDGFKIIGEKFFNEFQINSEED